MSSHLAPTLLALSLILVLPSPLRAQDGTDTSDEALGDPAEADVEAVVDAPRTTADVRRAVTLERGRAFTTDFFSGEFDPLWAAFSTEMKLAMGSVETLGVFRGQVADQLGRETALVGEDVQLGAGTHVYKRTARFEKLEQLIEVVFSLSEDGTIAGFTIQPVRTEAPSEYLDYQTKTALELPFEGAWDIFWGGRTLDVNYHTFTRDQRFAYDILIIQDGSTHTGEGTRNEDYHCFGLPVLAPGAGRIVVATKGVHDNVPGEMNPEQAVGNHVVIDHGNGEFSLLAHFRQGSLEVKVGDEVIQGQLLGRCGNSGNSSEAHIHYHLQDTAVPFAGAGMPAQFLGYRLGEQLIDRGEPVKGQTVRNN